MLIIKKYSYNNINGQTVIEILIATTILVLIFAGAAMVVFGNRSELTDKKLASQAESYAAEGIEAVKSIAKRDWTLLTTGDHGLAFQNNQWYFYGSSTKTGIFNRVINVSSTADNYINTINSTVSWNLEESTRNLSIDVTLQLTDWQGVLDSGGDTGGGGTIPDWTNPKTLGSIDLGPGVSAHDLDVIDKIVYMVGVASDIKKNDFFIIDATNGQSPIIKSAIDAGVGLVSIDGIGDFAFTAQKDKNYQLQIFDTRDINNPTTTAKFALPGIGGSGAEGLSVMYQNDKVYVGTEAANGPEFHIVNVADRWNPSSLGSKEIGANVNAMFIKGKYAYLATSDSSEELKVYNVSDPSNIAYVSGFNATGTNSGLSIYVVGSKLYLGRKGDSNSNNHEFLILDISNVSSIKLLGSKEIGDDVIDFKTRDNLAFLGTSNANSEVQIYDISNPLDIYMISSFNYPQVGQGVDYESNLVYVAVRSNDALRIITSQQ